MKEKICGVYDENERYAIRLTDYINEKKIVPYQAMAFSTMDALLENSEKYVFAVLLAPEEMKEVLENTVSSSKYVFLTNEKREEDNCICRYQSADHIVKELLVNIELDKYTKTANKIKCRVYMVFSPATKCFKTTLAMGLALWAGKKGKALYINLEQYSGLENILTNNNGGLSEAIFQYELDCQNAVDKIISCTDRINDFDYLFPADCPEDIADFTTDRLHDFLYDLSESDRYTDIIVDCGDIISRPWKLMDLAHTVIIPEPLDYMGKRKVEQFEKFMIKSNRKRIMEKIKKINMKYEPDIAGYEINFRYLESQAMEQIFRRCIDE